MPLYNLIEYSDKYSKASRTLWQYDKDEQALNDITIDIEGANETDSLILKKNNRSNK